MTRKPRNAKKPAATEQAPIGATEPASGPAPEGEAMVVVDGGGAIEAGGPQQPAEPLQSGGEPEQRPEGDTALSTDALFPPAGGEPVAGHGGRGSVGGGSDGASGPDDATAQPEEGAPAGGPDPSEGPDAELGLTFEVRPAEDILAIDAVSFACRAGQVAAAEIFMLLEGVDPLHAVIWYMSGQPRAPIMEDAEIARIEAEVAKLAAYVCNNRTSHGERLRNYAENQGMPVLTLAWADTPLPTRMAYVVFAETCLTVYQAIDFAQSAEKAARAVEARPDNPPLKREDSIFEETESMGEMIPGVLEGLAEADRQRAKAGDGRVTFNPIAEPHGSHMIGGSGFLPIGASETD